MKARVLKCLLLGSVLAVGVIVYRGLPDFNKRVVPTDKNMQGLKVRPAEPTKSVPNEAHELKVLEVALKKKPGHAPVLFEMAKIEAGQGHFQDAARHLQELLRSEPGNKEARLELGKDLFQLGDIQGAIEQTSEILKAHPNYEDALYNLGAIYANLGNKDRAAVYWKRLIAIDSKSESGRKAEQMMSQLQASAR